MVTLTIWYGSAHSLNSIVDSYLVIIMNIGIDNDLCYIINITLYLHR